MAEKTEHIRSISVEDWHALATEGSDIPITVCLNGDSMGPLIRKNKDKVTILPLRRAARAGDIVLFADSTGRYVVHRVWKCSEDRVITLGDHCKRPDPPLQCWQVWGLVTQVKRGNRNIPVDNPIARRLGKLWMALLPFRRRYYRINNRWKEHGT